MIAEDRPYCEWTNGQLEDAVPTDDIDREILLRLESRRQELQDYKGTIADTPGVVLEVEKWIAGIDARIAMRKNLRQVLQIGDRVEVVGDRRQELNGGKGIIEAIIQDLFFVRFDPPIANCGYGSAASVPLRNLTKI